MEQERKERVKTLVWIMLALLLQFVVQFIFQMIMAISFAMVDIANGVLTYDAAGTIFYNGQDITQQKVFEEYLNRYIYGTAAYSTLLATPVVLIGIFIFSRIREKKITTLLPVNRFPVVPNILSFIIGLAICFPATFIVSNTFLSNLSSEASGEMISIFQHTPSWVLFLAFAVFGPIMEEFIFRGFVYGQLERGMQRWRNTLDEKYEEMKEELSRDEDGEMQQRIIRKKLDKVQQKIPVYIIVVQGILFGAVHGNLLQFIYTTPLGMLFGMMRYYTKSIWASVLAHIGFNTFTIGSFILFSHEDWAITQKLAEVSDTTCLLITIPIFAVALLLFEMTVKKQGKTHEKTSQNT